MKKQLRKSILQLRDALTYKERREKSREITKRVTVQKEFQSADKFLLFASYKSEVDTAELLQYALATGKAVYMPKVLGDEMEFYQISSEEDLKEGYCGIREPEAELSKRFVPKQNERILIIVPGAVFDINGNRIGYGGGYYDRFLKYMDKCAEHMSQSVNIYKMAVAFECQMVETGVIPTEMHDVRVDSIVTEKGYIAKQ